MEGLFGRLDQNPIDVDGKNGRENKEKRTEGRKETGNG
jgi:hypothetical protein